MKTTIRFFALIAFTGLVLQSCNDDDDDPAIAAPVISNFEYGEGSSHSDDQVAYKGSDIHMEANITAEAKVSSISLEIHSHEATPADGEVEWDYEHTYTDAKYLVINPTFHEHVDVPTNIPAGEYHIVLTVTDELGNSTEVEGHVHILDSITLSGISISETVVRGSDLHAEFMINAVNGIHEITVDIHAHGLAIGTGEEEWHFEQTFSEGFHDLTEAEFHEHFDVPATAPAGEYHITITVVDEDANSIEYETHVVVTAE